MEGGRYKKEIEGQRANEGEREREREANIEAATHPTLSTSLLSRGR